MPYIKQEKREKLNPLIAAVPIMGMGLGDLNYLFSMIIKRYISVHKPSYSVYAGIVGMLITLKDELNRRVVIPYEDLKIKENGDIYE